MTKYLQDVTHQPFWHFGAADYVFGTLFIILAFSILALYSKAKRKANDYKGRQMIKYKKQNPKSTNNYKMTGLFLPPWERAKLFAPLLFFAVFAIIGFSFLVGQPIKLFST